MRVLIQFFNEQHWIHFRYAEFDALIEFNGLCPTEVYTKSIFNSKEYYSPFVIANFPNREVVQAICSRSILIRSAIELWCCADSIENMILTVNNSNDLNYKEVEILISSYKNMERSVSESYKWSFVLESFGHSLTWEEKEKFRVALNLEVNFPVFKSLKVSLKQPDISLICILNYAKIGSYNITSLIEEEASEHQGQLQLQQLYFGRHIAYGGMKTEVIKYDLKKRMYVGPTSLDHVLSMIICNIVHISNGSFILDPFVGTASLLVAATHFQGCCFGTDIDIRVLKGDMYAGKECKEVKRTIFDNFQQYGLPLPELIRADNHLFHMHFMDNHNEHTKCIGYEFFDAIISDPPYGIRAGARKSGRKNLTYHVPEDLRYDHVPHTQQYAVEEVMLDLLNTAALSLKVGGVLAYLIPTPYDFKEALDLPIHPCLEQIQICWQPLSCRHGRHLVVLRKTCAYTQLLKDSYREYCDGILRLCSQLDRSVENWEALALNEPSNEQISTMSRDDICKYHLSGGGFTSLIIRLDRALSNTAFEDSAVVKRQSKGSLKRRNTKNEMIKRRELRCSLTTGIEEHHQNNL